MSKQKHINKFVNFYLAQGHDVLTARVEPWQLLAPTRPNSSQVTAGTVVDILAERQTPILLHGFSVGAYCWGECLAHIKHTRNPAIADIPRRIVGCMWDSAADVNYLPIGVSRAVTDFPPLQRTLEASLKLHLKLFYKPSTQYYWRAHELLFSGIVPVPAMALVSKADPVGAVAASDEWMKSLRSHGIESYLKVFEKSRHVCHFQKHQEEYKAVVSAFLDKIGLLQYPESVPEYDGDEDEQLEKIAMTV